MHLSKQLDVVKLLKERKVGEGLGKGNLLKILF